MFSVLDDYIDSLKGLAHFDVDWEQQNKLSLLSNCLDQIASQGWSDEKVLSTDTGKLNTLIHGLEQLQKPTDPSGIERLWNEWNRQNDLKYKLKNLKNLRELYCDGLDYPNGPIKQCPEGLIVTSEIEPKAEGCVEILLGNTPASFIKSDALEMIIELNEHNGKSLMEKIDFMELWR